MLLFFESIAGTLHLHEYLFSWRIYHISPLYINRVTALRESTEIVVPSLFYHFRKDKARSTWSRWCFGRNTVRDVSSTCQGNKSIGETNPISRSCIKCENANFSLVIVLIRQNFLNNWLCMSRLFSKYSQRRISSNACVMRRINCSETFSNDNIARIVTGNVPSRISSFNNKNHISILISRCVKVKMKIQDPTALFRAKLQSWKCESCNDPHKNFLLTYYT